MSDENQLNIQQQINDAIRTQNELLSRQAQITTSQISLQLELNNVMRGEELAGMQERLDNINSSLQNVAAATTTLGAATQQATVQQGKFAKITDKINAKTVKSAGLFAGLWATMKNWGGTAMTTFGGILSSVTSLTGGIFSLGKSILMAPFQMLGGLIDMASQGGGGGRPIAEAWEEVRGVFGDLSRGSGRMVSKTIKQIRGQSRNLAGSGLRLSKVWGRGRQGVAAMMKDVSKTAEEMGPAFNLVGKEFMAAGAQLTIYQKGLGMTGEDMKYMAKRAKTMGTSMKQQLHETANLSLQMGKKFNLSSKDISRDMSKMTKDFSNFGSMSKKEMAATSVFARKLGMEIEDMMGVIDKWDNFEGAAEGASMLAQSFGMNIDAMEMMNAQSPAARIDMLRKSFHETGKSVKDLTRQERKLLEEQVGLKGAALDSALANENMGMSYEDIQAAAEDSAEQQMSEKDAMVEMAKAINKVVESGGGQGFTGFWDAFTKGLTKGMANTKEFRDVLQKIRTALKQVHKFGMWVGCMFIKHFPGVKNVLAGLSAAFDPKHIKELIRDFKAAITDFFADINSENPDKKKNALDRLLCRLSKAFGDFGDKKGEAWGLLMKGWRKIKSTLFTLMLQIPIVVMKGLTAAFKKITTWMKGDGKKKGAKGVGTPLQDGIKEALANIKTLWPELKASFMEMISTAFTKFGDDAKSGGSTIWKILKVVLFGSVAKGIIALIANMLMGKVLGGIVSSVFGLGPGVAGAFGGMLQKVFIGGTAAIVGVAAGKKFKEKFGKFKKDMGGEFKKKDGPLKAKVAAFASSVSGGLLPDKTAMGIAEWVVGIIDKISSAFSGLGTGKGGFFGKMFPKGTGKAVVKVFRDIKNWIMAIFSGDKKKKDDAFAGLKKSACLAKEKLLGIFTGIGDRILGMFGFEGKDGKSVWQTLKDDAKSAFKNIRDKIAMVIATVVILWEKAKLAFAEVKKMLGLDSGKKKDKGKGGAEKAATSAMSGIASGLKGIIDPIKCIFDKVKGVIGEGGIGAMMDKAGTVMAGVKETANALKVVITAIVNDPKVMDFAKRITGVFGEGGLDRSIKNIKCMVDKVIDNMPVMTQLITMIIASAADAAKGIIGENGMQGLIDGATKIVDKAVKGVSQSIKDVKTLFTDPALLMVLKSIEAIVGKGGINAALGKASGAAKGIAESFGSIDVTKLIPKNLEMDFQFPNVGQIFTDSIVANTTKIRRALLGIFEGMSIVALLRGKGESEVFKDQTAGQRRRMQMRARKASERLRAGAKLGIKTKVESQGPNINAHKAAMDAITAKNQALQAKISQMSKSKETVQQLNKITQPDSPQNQIDAALTCAIDAQTRTIAEREAALTGLNVVIKSMVDEYSLISEIMNDMTPVNLMAKLNEFGQNLAITSENLVIENKPINVTVNLSVSMNANNIASALSNPNITTRGTLAKAGGE